MIAADIAPLSNLQRLTHLDVSLSTHYDSGDPVPAGLLAALQHLTQLQYLGVHNCCDKVGAEQGHDSYQCFSALTASTQLTALHISHPFRMPLRRKAFRHMFPAGRVLPHLRVLFLAGKQWYAVSRFRCVEAAQVAMIAASCPALQKLVLWDVISTGFDISCLAQLPAGVAQVTGRWGKLLWTRPTP